MGFIDFGIIDAIDILVVALLLWRIYRAIKNTPSLAIFTGIFLVYLLWIVVRMLHMELLSLILGQVVGIGPIALVIVFQQEIRRYLQEIGTRYAVTRKGFLRRLFTRKGREQDAEAEYIEELSAACFTMSATRTGALIAIERQSYLDPYAETGDMIDAELSKRLIENIFFKNSPLHDGAMIVRNERILAARCILPSSDNPNLPAHYGMRHRAAIGLTEHSDAIVVVVSEETGNVSIVDKGKRMIVATKEELSHSVAQKLLQD